MIFPSPGWSSLPPSESPRSPGWIRSDEVLLRGQVGVRVGGLSLEASRIPESGMMLSSLRGWWESAPDDTEQIGHWAGDGVIALEQGLAPRTIELRGLMLGSDRGSMGQTLRTRGDMSRLRRAVLVVDERALGFTREADVRRIDVEFTDLAPNVVRFDLTLQADDPLRYGSGAVVLANGANTLVNRGDATAYPVLDLVGPHSAITVAHAGGSWTFTALASGQSRTVDLRNGDIWNGQTRVFGAEAGPAPVVPAGGASWTISGLGSGTARARRTEAWT